MVDLSAAIWDLVSDYESEPGGSGTNERLDATMQELPVSPIGHESSGNYAYEGSDTRVQDLSATAVGAHDAKDITRSRQPRRMHRKTLLLTIGRGTGYRHRRGLY